MKNFDYPYINDSPIDLSGREGYDDEVCDDIDTVLTNTPRTFPDVINEWTNTLVELNAQAVSVETIALLLRVGMLGQKLIYEANNIGMETAAKWLKEANDGLDS